MSPDINAAHAGVACLFGGLASIPVLFGAAWVLPAPYLWLFAACWTVALAGFIAVGAFTDPQARTCKYCGEPVGDGDG